MAPSHLHQPPPPPITFAEAMASLKLGKRADYKVLRRQLEVTEPQALLERYVMQPAIVVNDI